MRIRWTPEAVDNLDTICSYIAEDSPEAALKVARTLFSGIEKLTDFPHVVIYRVSEEDVEILHIWHGAQDWK